jgi:hypothetical protein
VHTQLFYIVEAKIALIDDDLGRSVYNFSELDTFYGYKGYEDMEHKDRKNRNQAVDYRNGYFRHRHASQIGENESYDEFKGLQFRKLPFPHKPHQNEKANIYDNRTQKNNQHNNIIMRFYPFFIDEKNKKLRP